MRETKEVEMEIPKETHGVEAFNDLLLITTVEVSESSFSAHNEMGGLQDYPCTMREITDVILFEHVGDELRQIPKEAITSNPELHHIVGKYVNRAMERAEQ